MEDKDKRLQEIYMQLQMASQQIQQMNEQIAMLDGQIGTLQTLRDSLADVETLKKGADTYSQLGAGIFVKSKIEDTAEVLVEVGARVFVGKTVVDAQETVGRQIELSVNYLGQMRASLQMMNQHAATLQNEAEGFVK